MKLQVSRKSLDRISLVDEDGNEIASKTGDITTADSELYLRMSRCWNAMEGIYLNNAIFLRGNSVRSVLADAERKRLALETAINNIIAEFERLKGLTMKDGRVSDALYLDGVLTVIETRTKDALAKAGTLPTTKPWAPPVVED